MSVFEARKAKILALLSQPDDSYIDASPKGSIDEGVRQLVDEINQQDGLVTTSSCAGRVAVYLEGTSGTDSITSDASDDERKPMTSSGGKGGGRWLFVSHDPVQTDSLADAGEVLKLLSLAETSTYSVSHTQSSFIRFKFEPLILHILCSSLSKARQVLGSALSAGFRESGISSINDSTNSVMVAIRSTGLAFDSIIAQTHDNGGLLMVSLLVSEDYIRLLIDVGNERFKANEVRKDRFQTALMQAIHSQKHNTEWEPADARRARKRAEGLARQAHIEHDSTAQPT